MIALIKLLIVLVLSIFTAEPAEEKITENVDYLELYQKQEIDIFIRPSETYVAS